MNNGNDNDNGKLKSSEPHRYRTPNPLRFVTGFAVLLDSAFVLRANPSIRCLSIASRESKRGCRVQLPAVT